MSNDKRDKVVQLLVEEYDFLQVDAEMAVDDNADEVDWDDSADDIAETIDNLEN